MRYLITQYKFDNSIHGDLIPEFNEEFTEYEVVDDNIEGNITTRSIYSTELPTMIRFGAKTNENINRTNSLLEVLSINTSNVTDMKYMFCYCEKMVSLNNCNFNTEKVKSFSYMFFNCKSLTSLNISNWNTSNINNMQYMFYNCNSLNSLDVSNWDTSNVTDMGNLFYECNSLNSLDVSNWDTSNVTDMGNLFYKCNSITSLDVSNFDTSKVTDMSKMFRDCKSITSLDVSNFNTSNVNDMEAMFYGCNSITSLDVSNFNTSNVTNMGDLFRECKSLTSLDASNFITSKVTDMNSMFRDCNSLTSLDLSNFITSNVTDMQNMFYNCKSLTSLDVSTWDTSNVNNMKQMFRDCNSLTSLDVSSFDTNKLDNMEMMFSDCNNLTSIDLSNFDTSNTTDMDGLFYSCDNLININISNWDLNNITDFTGVFYETPDLRTIIINNSDYNSVNKVISQLPTRTSDSMCTLTIAGIDDNTQVDATTSESKYWNIINQYKITEYKFNNTIYDLIPVFNEGFTYTYEDVVDGVVTTRTIYSDNLPNTVRFSTCSTNGQGCDGRELALLELLYLNNSNLLTESQMFQSCVNLTKVEGFTSNTMHQTNHMFNNCQSLTSLDVSNWDNSNVTSMFQMFSYCHSLTSLDVSNWNTSNVTDMSYMFFNCELLTSLDVSNFNTSNVTNMSHMFYYCNSLTSLDLSNWDNGNVTNMEYMFARCYELNSIIGIEDWDVSNVETMESMFFYTKVSELDLSNWDTNSLTEMKWMFCDCYMLRSLNVTGWNTSKVTSLAEVFAFYERGNHNLIEIIGLNTWDVSNVTNMYSMFWECRSLKSLDLSGWDMRNATYIEWMFCDCESLESLRLNKWQLNDGVAYADMFSSYTYNGCPKLKYIEMNYSDYQSINKIIEVVPTKTRSNRSTMFVGGVDDMSQVNISSASSNFWNVKNKYIITRYKYDNSIYENLIPKFNTEFTDYEIVDEYLDIKNIMTTSTETVMLMDYNAEPDEHGVLTTEYEVETVNEFLLGNIVTRSIYSEELPTKIRFGDTESDNPKALLAIIHLNTCSLTTMKDMFYHCDNLTSINASNWDTSNVTNMSAMFSECYNLTSLDVSNWNTRNVYDMSYMFYYCELLNSLDVSNWDTSKVTNMGCMFDGCILLNSLGDVSNWDTSKVTDMSTMFSQCYSLTSLDVSNFNTSKVTNMEYMFYGCELLTSLDVSNWDTSNVTYTGHMFYNCILLTSLDLSNWDTKNFITVDHMFYGTSSIGDLDLNGWDTSNITNMNSTFQYCFAPTINVSNWDTSNVTDMGYMFYGCELLTSLDISNWDTSNVTNMYVMFCECLSLKELNISNWDVSKVTDMEWMFCDCESLKTLKINGWRNITASVTDLFSPYTYNGCPKLKYIEMNYSDYQSINKIIEVLPTKTQHELGTMIVARVDNMSQVNISYASSKFWNVVDKYLIAKYKFDKSIYENLIPEFNAEFTEYTISDEYLDTENIVNTNTENIVTFNGDEFDENGLPMTTEYEVETTSEFLAENIVTRSIWLSDYQTSINVKENLAFEDITTNNTIFYKPMHLDNGDVEFICSPWELCQIDLSNYVGQNVNISFTVSNKPNDWCELWVTLDGQGDTVVSQWCDDEIMSMNYSRTLNVSNNYPYLWIEGMNCILTNISIKVNNQHVFPDKMDSKAYPLYDKGFYIHSPEYKNDSLIFSHKWTAMYVDVRDYIGKNIEITFNAIGKPNDYNWSELELYQFNGNEGMEKIEDRLFCKELNTTKIINRTYTVNVTHGYIYLGGMGVTISNLNIVVNELPTMMRFGNPNANNNDSNEVKQRFGSLISVEELNAEELVDCSLMFHACSNLKYVNNLTILSKCKNVYGMFSNCKSLTLLDVSGFDTSKVTNMGQMFYICKSLTSLDVSNFDTSNVTNMGEMFRDCKSLTTVGNLSDWNTSKVTNMGHMFYYCTSLTSLDLSNWDTSKVEMTPFMFQGCTSLTSVGDLSNWNTNRLGNTQYMFAYCNSLTSIGDVSNWDTSRIVNMEVMFYNCNSLTSLDLSNWDTSNVTNMFQMFYNCNSLTSVGDLSNWDTSKVTNMGQMFSYCKSLTSLDVSNFDTSNVTNMSQMFRDCTSLTSLDLSNWDTSKVTSMYQMFRECNSLTSLDLSNFNTSNVTGMDQMFHNCNLLKTLYSYKVDTNTINSIINQLSTTNIPNAKVKLRGIGKYNGINKELLLSKNWKLEIVDIINIPTVNNRKVKIKSGRTRINNISRYN